MLLAEFFMNSRKARQTRPALLVGSSLRFSGGSKRASTSHFPLGWSVMVRVTFMANNFHSRFVSGPDADSGFQSPPAGAQTISGRAPRGGDDRVRVSFRHSMCFEASRGAAPTPPSTCGSGDTAPGRRRGRRGCSGTACRTAHISSPRIPPAQSSFVRFDGGRRLEGRLYGVHFHFFLPFFGVSGHGLRA